MPVSLGVNIDHVATLRQARLGKEPQPVRAALVCLAAGADSIVVHLREDRRHIQDDDLYLLRKVLKGRLNLEMSSAAEIVGIACKVKPDQATLVPEKRRELTTEGGLDISANFRKVAQAIKKLRESGIAVSLFIDPDKDQIDAADEAGARIIELHTGRYAGSRNKKERGRFYSQIREACKYAIGKNITVNAGHGLDYENVSPIAAIPGINELNIGYSIICRAVFCGLDRAVREMKALIEK
ncbi:MAG: pyridoxine 5'-phosphate synthase [Candidatus Omnitrophica bacterium]|nr:pyridoxine 5'-phosphate synthase [Candidatus Omnitrophota bacterium]MDD5512791.1 pyridoxine 5'-phosphate synthase [Candidatus Omnitrophota bacterium]